MKYRVEIIKIEKWLKNYWEKILILFNADAPEDLAEISVLHTDMI